MTKKKKFSTKFILVYLLFIIISVIVSFYLSGQREKKYQFANSNMNSNNYDIAYEEFMKLGEYKNSKELALKARNKIAIYEEGIMYYNSKDYKLALEKFKEIKDYKDSDDYFKKTKYNLAIEYYDNKDYDKAKQLFLELDGFKDSEEYLDEIDKITVVKLTEDLYAKACKSFENKDYETALSYFESIKGYNDSEEKAKECEMQLKRKNLNNVVAAGIRYSVAILDKENVVAVGDNDKKQCDVEKFKNMISIDAGGCLTIGLNANGKVKVAGTYDEGYKIDTTENKWNKERFIDVAAGERFVVGLTKNGNIVADGHGDDGQIDFKDWDKEKIIAIDAGWRFTVGLTENKILKFNGLYGTQLNDFLNHKKEWKDVVNISAAGGDPTNKNRGEGHTVGLKSDGTVVAIGDNSWGQCDVNGKKWRKIVKVVAGDWYTVALKENGQVLITGENRPGTKYIDEDVLNKANAKKDIVDIAAGYGQTILIHKNGSISAFGFNEEGKCSEIQKWTISNPHF